MCLGGKDSYDAYKHGDFDRWKAADTQAYNLQTQIDSGKLKGPALARARRQLRVANQNANSLVGQVNKDTAARLDVREVNRQQDITTGKGKIDKAFQQFTPDYYNNFGKSYTNFYSPQLNDQYAQARGKLTAALAGKGTLESTAGIGMEGRLAKERDTAATTIGNEAQDAKNKLRSNVERGKSDLYALNESSADPQAINNRAIGEATALVAPPAFSPLGQVFGQFLGNVFSGFGGQNGQSNPYYKPYQSSSFSTSPSGSGSGTVYN